MNANALRAGSNDNVLEPIDGPQGQRLSTNVHQSRVARRYSLRASISASATRALAALRRPSRSPLRRATGSAHVWQLRCDLSALRTPGAAGAGFARWLAAAWPLGYGPVGGRIRKASSPGPLSLPRWVAAQSSSFGVGASLPADRDHFRFAHFARSARALVGGN